MLAGLILGAIAAFIIDGKFKRAGIYAIAGAVLSFVGLIHGLQLGFGASPAVALGYLIMAAICFGFSYLDQATPG